MATSGERADPAQDGRGREAEKRFPTRPPSGRWLVAVALLAYALIVVVKSAPHGFDVSRLVVAGDRFFAKRDLFYPIYVESHSDGYDGQFYYRLALDPLTHQRVAYGITMEPNPTVRAQRILYPALAWALSFGNGALVPIMLVAINLASVAAMTVVALRLTRYYALPAGSALLLPFYPGFILSMARDTIEIVATTLALAALLAATERRFWIAALLAAAAVLARETTLLYLAGFGMMAVYRSVRARRLDPGVLPCLIPVIVYAMWQAILHHIWGTLPIQELGPHDLSPVPFLDYGRWLAIHWRAAMTGGLVYRLAFDALADLLVFVFVAYLLVRFRRMAPGNPAITLSWVFYAGLACFFTGAIWNEPYGFLRVLCDVYALGVAALIANRDTVALRRLTSAVAVTWLATVGYIL